MNYNYTIIFHTATQEVRREGVGQFYPSNNSFSTDDMLWAMAEEFGRPTSIEVRMSFMPTGIVGME